VGLWLEELRPYVGERRASRGWRLAKTGWRLLRTDRSLVVLSLLLAMAILGLGVLAEHFAPGFSSSSTDPGRHLPASLLVAALGAGVASFLLVAVASAADGALDGAPLTLAEALGDARECLGPIVGWAAISVAAWFGARLLAWALGLHWLMAPLSAAWFFATLFALPAIAIARLGVGGAAAESLHLSRAHWREVCAGLLGIFFFAGVAMLIPSGMIEHAAALDQRGSGTDYPLAIGGLVLVTVLIALAAVTREAFAVLLLRESLDDLPGPEHGARRPRRRAKVARACGALAAVIAVVVAFGALTDGDRETLDASRAPGTNFTAIVANPSGIELPDGAAVVYRGDEVGVVLGSHREGSDLSVTFHVDPGIGPERTPASLRIVDAGALGPLLVLIPAPGVPSGGQAQPF